jgi:hypothetical protein
MGRGWWVWVRAARAAGIAKAVAFALLAACHPLGVGPAPPPPSVDALAALAPGLDPTVLRLALRASRCAARAGLVAEPGLLTVIDYTRPSTEPRLWVLDLTTRTLRHRELVAHGRGTGELYAARFSNDAGSTQSSLGLFVTGAPYVGRHGRSLRLVGLEPGVNDHAVARAIVLHGADYVSAAFAADQGRLGRSHGCPAVRSDVAAAVIDVIAGGTPLFAYYPDPAWLEHSRFLGAACVDDGAKP